jgi:hypothetical protein
MLGEVPIVEHVAAKDSEYKKPCQLNSSAFSRLCFDKTMSIVK